MLYARVVVGLPVNGPFDYIVPESLKNRIKVGMRAMVNFRTKKLVGYVVGLSKETKIAKLKTILDLVDESPILNKTMLLLTKELSDYYCCSWGEAIETALPEGLRRGRRIGRTLQGKVADLKSRNNSGAVLIHDLDDAKRWEFYLEGIKESLMNKRSAILLFPDIKAALKAKEKLSTFSDFNLGLLYRKQPKELDEWLRVKEGKVNLVLGTRSAIFAPLNNLGLVIVDEEENNVYKQDQVPHYNAINIAMIRARLEKAELILGTKTPSLESLYLAQKRKIQYELIPRYDDFPEVKVVDLKSSFFSGSRKGAFFSKFLEDSVYSTLKSKGKVLLFLNRRGFATSSFCHNCGIALKCPRCNVNLVYHFQDGVLNCHYCNFKMQTPKICPHCNSGYIKFSGLGTEKVESELCRIFPQARIRRTDEKRPFDINDVDILISTQSIFRTQGYKFNLVGVLAIDNSLNRVDLRASEKTFALLIGLLVLAKEKLVIQTRLPQHHIFEALIKRDLNIFYNKELKQRKQLKFSPYVHMVSVKLRAKKEDMVEEAARRLFERLKERNKDKAIKFLSVNPAQPRKLRGNFYWDVLIISRDIKKVNRFLKINLKDFAHSGIIVTVDVDPT